VTPDLIVITDESLSDDEIERRSTRFLAAVPPASTALQLRDRKRSARQLLQLAERLAAICERHGAPLYVNDRVDVALAVRARGVHLGKRSIAIADARRALGPDGFFSVAAHRVEDVDLACREGASAALVSPIFETPGKGTPRGPQFLAEARARASSFALYALGGVDVSRAGECVDAGADGVAVIRAVFHADDVAGAANALVDVVRARRTR